MIIFTKIRNWVIGVVYRQVLKRIFFLRDPEKVHDAMTAAGAFLGRFGITRTLTRALFYFQNPILTQTIAGITFTNPIGLAAGFDKDAQLTQILPEVGFGFEEIGSVTGEPCPGNSGTRLWRLKNSKSLLVYYGLKNQGAVVLSEKISRLNFKYPLGISIAKTNSADTVEESAGIRDYVKAYSAFEQQGLGDYFTINISCPNAFGGEPFNSPDKLDRLLTAIDNAGKTKPIFLKMPAELPFTTIDELLEVARRHKITGLICTNLAKNRSNPNIKDEDVPSMGGMSGKVVEDLSNNLIKYIYQKTGSEFVIIGCGGVFTAADAYKKIRLGASLIQMITGMIYQGPQVISEINLGLAELLKKDGFTNLSQAIGADLK